MTKPRDQERAMFANLLNRRRGKAKGKGARLSPAGLRKLQARRAPHSRGRDEATTADEVLQPGSPELDRWLEAPNRVDVEGIDTAPKGLFKRKAKPSP